MEKSLRKTEIYTQLVQTGPWSRYLADLTVKLWICANIPHREQWFGLLALRKWLTILHPVGISYIQRSDIEMNQN